MDSYIKQIEFLEIKDIKVAEASARSIYTNVAFVYAIISPNNRVYIGSTIDLKARWFNYKKLYCESQPMLYNSLKKYSPEAHKFLVIWVGCEKDRHKIESYYGTVFETLNPKKGLNLSLPVGDENVPTKINLFKIAQFDLEGRRLCTYNSVKEAAIAVNTEPVNIRNAINGKVRHSNKYQWLKFSYGEIIPDTIKPLEIQQKVVDLYCSDGFYYKSFSSLKEASCFLKVSIAAVNACLRGKLSTVKGYQIKYGKIGQTPVKNIEPVKYHFKRIGKNDRHLTVYNAESGTKIDIYENVRSAAQATKVSATTIKNRLSQSSLKPVKNFVFVKGTSNADNIIPSVQSTFKVAVFFKGVLQSLQNSVNAASKLSGVNTHTIDSRISGKIKTPIRDYFFVRVGKDDAVPNKIKIEQIKIDKLKMSSKNTIALYNEEYLSLTTTFKNIAKTARWLGVTKNPVRYRLENKTALPLKGYYVISVPANTIPNQNIERPVLNKASNKNKVCVEVYDAVSGNIKAAYPSISAAAFDNKVSLSAVSNRVNCKYTTPLKGLIYKIKTN